MRSARPPWPKSEFLERSPMLTRSWPNLAETRPRPSRSRPKLGQVGPELGRAQARSAQVRPKPSGLRERCRARFGLSREMVCIGITLVLHRYCIAPVLHWTVQFQHGTSTRPGSFQTPIQGCPFRSEMPDDHRFVPLDPHLPPECPKRADISPKHKCWVEPRSLIVRIIIIRMIRNINVGLNPLHGFEPNLARQALRMALEPLVATPQRMRSSQRMASEQCVCVCVPSPQRVASS